MSIHNSAEPCPLFQANCKTITASILLAACAATALVLGILGWLQFIPDLHSAAGPMVFGSSTVLGLDFIWIIVLGVLNRNKQPANPPLQPTNTPVQADNHPIQPPKHMENSHFNPDPTPSLPTQTIVRPILQGTEKVDPLNEPLDPVLYGLKKIEGPGFHIVTRTTRQGVIDVTKMKLDDGTWDKNLPFYYRHIKYTHPPKFDPKQEFFPEGDVLQTPVLMEFDQDFKPKQGKNYFIMHSTPAPKPGQDEAKYLKEIEEIYFALLEQQVLSNPEHLLTNYWGMGAFIRDYLKATYGENHKECFNFRIRFAQRLAKAYCRLIDSYPDKIFKFYVGGPVGTSKSFPESYKQEPRDNYNALVLAFGHCEERYKKQIYFCPETDIFVKAQEISDTEYKHLPVGEVAPVSAINASAPHKWGNHWYNGVNGDAFNAECAIEENVFRRSSALAYMASIVNQQNQCVKGIDDLVSHP